MNRRSYSAAVLISLALMSGCQAAGTVTVGQQRQDQSITTEVKSRLATNDQGGALTRIEVKTVENTVYLIGVVPNLGEKSKAEEIARQVKGVHRVVSHITVIQAASS